MIAIERYALKQLIDRYEGQEADAREQARKARDKRDELASGGTDQEPNAYANALDEISWNGGKHSAYGLVVKDLKELLKAASE